MIGDVVAEETTAVDVRDGRAESWLDSVLVATAVALIVLLPVELVSWVIVSDVTTHDASWVVDRWTSSLWRAVDWVFLVVALLHGGLSTVGRLGTTTSAWRLAAAGLVGAGIVALLIVASHTFFTLDVP